MTSHRFDMNSIQFDMASHRFDMNSIQFDMASHRFDMNSIQFESTSHRFDMNSIQFESTLYRFDMNSIQFESASHRFYMNSNFISLTDVLFPASCRENQSIWFNMNRKKNAFNKREYCKQLKWKCQEMIKHCANGRVNVWPFIMNVSRDALVKKKLFWKEWNSPVPYS